MIRKNLATLSSLSVPTASLQKVLYLILEYKKIRKKDVLKRTKNRKCKTKKQHTTSPNGRNNQPAISLNMRKIWSSV